ncbi:MAG TPA: hypothetical protein VMH61_02525 [Candidatus Acidoferrales bacterium]|nr:hypothetical protein [Candidatus Acidoferrales bacterium]
MRTRLGIAALLSSVALAGCSPRARPGAIAPEPEHLAHSIAALGFPGARRAFQVGAGSQVWSGEVALRWSVTGEEPPDVSPIAFEDDGVPGAHWRASSAAETLEFEAAASPRAELGDSSLELSVRVTAWAGSGAGPRSLALRTVIANAAIGPAIRAWDAARPPPGLAWRGRDAVGAGARLARVPGDCERSGAGDSLVALIRRTLAPGERASWTFWMPAYPLGPRVHASARDHDAVLADARTRWRERLDRGDRIDCGAPRFDRMERAARVTLLECLEREPEGLAVIGNPFQYRDVWLRDGARALRALSLCGFTAEADEGVRTLLGLQWPSGAFLSQRGQLDGAGQALWVFDQVASHPPDVALARELLDPALRGVGWIAEQSRLSRGLGLPWSGLLPYADPHDGERVSAPLVGDDAWAIAGEEATADLASLAGRDSIAGACRAIAADLRASFAVALAGTKVADVPPSWPGPGEDWGNLAVVFPTRVLAPTHPRARALLARLRARSPGLACYSSPDSLHSYLGADLAVTAMLAGDAGAADEYLDSLLAHSSSTLGQSEIFSRRDGDFGRNLPPHATAAAAVVELTHARLAFELPDTLLLGAGLDAAGWAHASLTGAPTRFGTLSVAFARPARGRFVVRWSGVDAPVRVRVPAGFALTSLAGDPARDEGGGWIALAAGAHSVTLIARPAAEHVR